MSTQTPTTDPPPAATPAEDSATPAAGPLPAVETDLTADQALERLEVASRRGRLPGFARGGQGGLFSVAAFGHPFDKVLIATSEPAGAGVRLKFRAKLPMKGPALFAAALAFSVWPGVRIMDHLIPVGWGWIPTWWWYLPLTIIPIPWAWRAVMRRTNAAAHESALKQIAQIASEVGGRAVPPSQA